MPGVGVTFFSVTMISCWWSWSRGSVLLEDRSDLDLAGRDPLCLVLTGCRAEQLTLGLHHEGCTRSGIALKRYPRTWPLAAPRRTVVRSRSRSAREKKKCGGRPGSTLLGARERDDGWSLFVSEDLYDALCLFVHRLRGTEQRSLLVERPAGPRHERGRDTSVVPFGSPRDVRRAGDVPRGVAASFERRADAAVRLDASGSPGSASCWRTPRSRRSSPSYERKLSCFSAVVPGRVEDARCVAPFDRPPSSPPMVSATVEAKPDYGVDERLVDRLARLRGAGQA